MVPYLLIQCLLWPYGTKLLYIGRIDYVFYYHLNQCRERESLISVPLTLVASQGMWRLCRNSEGLVGFPIHHISNSVVGMVGTSSLWMRNQNTERWCGVPEDTQVVSGINEPATQFSCFLFGVNFLIHLVFPQSEWGKGVNAFWVPVLCKFWY